MAKKKKALGKGLGALLGDDSRNEKEQVLFMCPIDMIKPNPYQPRFEVTEEELEELANSIKEKGVIQPLIVRETDDGYELITGERRWRASKLAGLKRIPVLIRDVAPQEVLELALIENIHREDLNPIEEAEAYRQLVEEFHLTQEEVAKRVGKERSTVTNYLRLLSLPDFVKEEVLKNSISMGHARALLSLGDETSMKELLEKIIKRALSVRETERLIKKEIKKRKKTGEKKVKDPWIEQLEELLMRGLGTKVQINRGRKGGKITIHFYSNEELSRIIDLFQLPTDELSF